LEIKKYLTIFVQKNISKQMDAIKKSCGEAIRQYREEQQLPLRKVAAHLDIDTSTLAKFEKNQRHPTREHISKLAGLFGLDEQDLLLIYLSDRVAYDLVGETNPEQVLKVAEEKIKYIRSKNTVQGVLGF
jgi:HTH-type transcriptional regulator, competence development regulator